MSYLFPRDCHISPNIVSLKFNPLQDMTVNNFFLTITLLNVYRTFSSSIHPAMNICVYLCCFCFSVAIEGSIAMDMRVQISFWGCLQFYRLNIQNWDLLIQYSIFNFWKYNNINALRISYTHTMYFDHIYPLLLSLTPPRSTSHIPNLYEHNVLFFKIYNTASLIFAVYIILGVEPSLECGWPARSHLVKENQVSFS